MGISTMKSTESGGFPQWPHRDVHGLGIQKATWISRFPLWGLLLVLPHGEDLDNLEIYTMRVI